MSRQSVADPAATSLLVSKMIGYSPYQIVKYVAENMDDIRVAATNIGIIENAVATVTTARDVVIAARDEIVPIQGQILALMDDVTVDANKAEQARDQAEDYAYLLSTIASGFYYTSLAEGAANEAEGDAYFVIDAESRAYWGVVQDGVGVKTAELITVAIGGASVLEAKGYRDQALAARDSVLGLADDLTAGIAHIDEVAEDITTNLADRAKVSDLSTYLGGTMIGYRQTGTGAVTKTLQSLITNVFRPEQFSDTFGTGGDDQPAMQAAQDAAHAAGGCVELPRGTIRVRKTVIIKVPTRGGGSQVTTIQAIASDYWAVERKPNATDDLSNSYLPILQVGKKPTDTFTPKTAVICSGFTVRGLCTRTAVPSGNRNDLGWFGDGIHVGRDSYTPGFEDVWVVACQNGFNTFNLTGHITWIKCKSSDNFYGWWIDHQSGDYRMYGTDLDGNMFSSVGFHGKNEESREGINSGTGLVGWSMFGGHMGFGPYAVYQPERGSPTGLGGMIDIYWAQTSMEALGNRGVNLAANSTTGRCVIEQVPQSFYAGSDGRYTIPTQPSKDYVYVLGTVNAFCRFGPQYPINTTSGKLGKITTHQGTVIMPGAWRYWETNNYNRLVDDSYTGVELTSNVAYAAGVTGSATTGVSHATQTVPDDLLNCGAFSVEVEVEVVAAAANNSLRMEVWTGPNADGSGSALRGLARRCPVLAGNSSIRVSQTIVNPRHKYVFVKFATNAGSVDLGVSGSVGRMILKPVRNGI